MNSEKWKDIKKVFNRALEINPPQRKDFLNDFGTEIRLEVLKMLDAIEEKDDLLENPIIDFQNIEDYLVPTRIGDYKIVREVGNGGMGVVYEAVRETEDFKQRVALKVIKRGMNNEIILKRFRAEQQILASLEHPNIGRFLDGGKTVENLPFYTMEFIEGLPINEYFEKTRLSQEEKINIFREVCSGVSFAHTNLIVHRDLKSSNIIITKDKTVKLLDFGIAKVLDVENAELNTATQFKMMTPQYASPEQIKGEKVTTLSDVYSLGIILYELLTGKLPYRTEGKTYAEIMQTITQTEPLRPSLAAKSETDFGKSLKGDLDNIILKTLEKEPSRRYQSVERLSEDLQKHLSGFPISARPHNLKYRFAKYYQRNKKTVLVGSLLILSLFLGIFGMIWQSLQTRQQKELAEKRFSEVRKIANNVLFKYQDEIEKLEGSTGVREMIVRDAIIYLDNLAKDAENDIELEHELALAYLKLGDVQGKIYEANVGNTAGAVESYEKSIRLLENVVKKNPHKESAKNDLIKSYQKRVQMMFRTGVSREEKEAILSKTIKLIEEVLISEPENKTRLARLTTHYILFGDFLGSGPDDKLGIEEKVKYHSKALENAEELYQIDPKNAENVMMMIRVHQRLGTDFFWLGELAENNNLTEESRQNFFKALSYHQKAVELVEEFVRLSPQDNQINRVKFAVYASYAESLILNGEARKALHYADLIMKISEKTLDKDKANREALLDYSEAHTVFARIYFKSGNYENAVEHYLKAEKIYNEIYQKDKNNFEAAHRIQVIYRDLSKVYRQTGDQNLAQYYQDKSDKFLTR